MTDYFTKKDAEGFKKEISEEFRRYMGILKEDFQRSLGFVIDGQKDLERKLTDKIESTATGLRKELTGKIEFTDKKLSNKIDSLRDELIAHRDNTEVHVQKARVKKRVWSLEFGV
ncbi:MAG: hypothetical protein M0Z70_02250 [Nitrospiraceae bacterium]|nr:hypothetical protein [Nitrospiraceae bacterium]